MKSPSTASIERAYNLARERYAAVGVDTGKVIEKLGKVPVSLHCWQGDDVGGFENFSGPLTGGIVATGNYPGKARTPDELRADASKALSLIPGTHRFNLHAFYGEFGGKKSIATKSFPSISRIGSVGPSLLASASTSTRPASPTPNPPAGSLYRMPMPAFAGSGSTIARPAGKLALRWARRWEPQPSPTSGYRTE